MNLSVIQRINQVDRESWNALVGDNNPFLRHEFLAGLESSGCVGTDAGWEPNHLVLHDGDRNLLGAIPLYLKYHSWGEYVFDWAWADAYQRAGLRYYPKLLCAIPFTPVSGARLLVNPRHADQDILRDTLARELVTIATDSGVSSLHVLFTNEQDNQALAKYDLIVRTGNQFHWRNAGYQDFDHYLGSFTSAKRKKIRRERRRVSEAGITMDALSGESLRQEHWDAMFRFYRLTILNHGASAYLNRDFFDYLQAEMSDQILLILAREGSRYIGGTLNVLGGDTLYGRYWGADTAYHSLHFEACYYQPIDYCIRHRMQRFEAGAQGEHKLSRGLLPTPTYSSHWLRDSRFKDAVVEYLQTETQHIDRYSDALHQHTPFRDGVR